MVEFVDNALEIVIEKDDLQAVLSIEKTNSGYRHLLATGDGQDSEKILQKPLLEYAPHRNDSTAFEWLREKIAPKTSRDHFRKDIWAPLIKEHQDASAYSEFQENGVGPELADLRNVIQKQVFIRTLDSSKSQPVELHVHFDDQDARLRLDTKTVQRPMEVAEAFEKTFGYAPAGIYDISSKDWNRDVRAWLAQNGRVEHVDEEDSEEQFIADKIAEGVSQLKIVHQAKELDPAGRERFAYYDGTVVWVHSDAVDARRERHDFAANLLDIKNWLKAADYLKKRPSTGYSSQPRGPKGDMGKCWPFDPDVFSDEKLEKEEEK